MKEEVQSAAHFVCEKLKENSHLSDEQCELFRTTLEELMLKRFENHWHPDKPLKGNAYRCININHEECVLDPMLNEAAMESFIDVEDLRTTFPDGLALWVDPYDVSYRLGRRSICPIFKRYNSNKPLSCTKKRMGNITARAPISQFPNAKSDVVLHSKLNTSAPSFVPTTMATQSLSSIWTSNWSGNYQPWSRMSSQNQHSQFHRYPDQTIYNRYHWHRSEKEQQDDRQLSNRKFEFRTVAQEAY